MKADEIVTTSAIERVARESRYVIFGWMTWPGEWPSTINYAYEYLALDNFSRL